MWPGKYKKSNSEFPTVGQMVMSPVRVEGGGTSIRKGVGMRGLKQNNFWKNHCPLEGIPINYYSI